MARGVISVGSRIRVSPASDALIKWAKENLVLDNPEYQNKMRLGLWIGNTPRLLHLYEEDGDDMTFPFGLLPYIMAVCPQYDVRSLFGEPTAVDFGTDTVPLYDYQKEAVDACVEKKFGILQSAAGSGKTQMGIAIIQKFGRKALWITHTKDLLYQSKERAELYMPKDLMGVITGGKVEIGKGITFATVQTLCNIDLSLYRNEWDVIICDECHRIAGTPAKMTMFSKCLNGLAARHKYGLSATVHRADGLIRETYSLLGDICYTVPDEAVGNKVMPVGVHPIETHLNNSKEYCGPDGMLIYAKLMSYLCQDEERCRLVARWILHDKGKSCLILSDRLGQLETIRNMLPPEMKRESALISGQMVSKTGKAQRQQAIEDMRTGKLKYLFATYNLAKEGLDIQRLERLYLATPHKDSAVITQAVGRIARTFPGKNEAICYDFVDANIRFLWNAWKVRQRVYRHNKQYFVEDSGL